MVDEARNLALENGEVSPILETLEKARSINRNDPLIAVNLGLTLGRAGRRAEALPLLMEAAFRGPRHWRLLCFFNSALSAFAQGNAESAISLLDLVMSELERGWERANHSPTNNSLVADLPGIGVWADEQFTQEERLSSAFELISRGLREYEKYHPIPESASRLAALYSKAAAVG